MEGMGTFELAGSGGDSNMRTAVHTRRIVDPFWGAKASGTLGRVTFATLSASDEAPGRPLDDGANPFPGRNKGFHIARGLYSLGKSSYAGAIVTDSEFASGHNRVAGGDVSLRWGQHQWNATALWSDSRSPDGSESKTGAAAQTSYVYDTKRWLFINQFEHYDTGFQMDTAFFNQTGITADWAFAALSLYPDAKKHPWLKRVVPFVFTRYVRDRLQGGDLRFVLPGLRMHFTRQGFFRLDVGAGEEPWAQRTFPIRFLRVFGGAQLTKWLNVFAFVNVGRSVFYDPLEPFGGRSRSYSAEVTFQPSSRFSQRVSYNRAEFDRLDGSQVFRVDVINTRTTYQFNRQFSLRGIVQYDSSRRRVLTDLLASFELLPGTVAYAGYGSLIESREWDGERLFDGPSGEYLTMRRGFFFKASYIHRF